jgi:hypothetical protein
MPDKDTATRKRFIEACELAVFNQIILLTVGVAISPEAVGLVSRFDVLDCDLSVFLFDFRANPVLTLLAP